MLAKHSIGFNKSSLKKCFSGESSLLIHAFKNDFIFIFDKIFIHFLCVCMLCGIHMPCCIYKWEINFLESVLSTHHAVTLSYLIGLAFTLMNEKTSPFIRSLMWGGSKGKKRHLPLSDNPSSIPGPTWQKEKPTSTRCPDSHMPMVRHLYKLTPLSHNKLCNWI